MDGERKRFISETDAVLLDPKPYEKEPTWLPPSTLPSDERDISEMLWQQMRLPDAQRKQEILFVHAPKRPGAARVDTADCVRAWVHGHHPPKGRALVVSSDPLIEYQRRVTEVLLVKSGATGIKVTAMGPAAALGGYDTPTRLCLLLDALAGSLFRARQQ